MSATHHRILIVGTIPYNKNTSSRAFDAYFHNWEKENIRQIFSNTKTPVKGHCGSLYQITDQRLLKRILHRVDEVGVVYNDADLPTDWTDNSLEVNNKFIDFLYKFGSKDTPFKYLARKLLWKRKYWDTQKLRDWLDEFKPECVFLAFSDDFFIPEIALYVANRYNIPIMSCIGDDYYFNEKKSLTPLYHLYRGKYKRLIKEVFSHHGSAIYIGDKIRDKYNKEFDLSGETVYLTSDIERHPFKPINIENPRITYCGNIRLGRNTSLVDIGEALQQINPSYKLDVYSAEKNKEFIEPLTNCNGVRYHGAVPYRDVMKIMNESDVLIIVEGFTEEQVNITRYSLSTKAADSMATGGQILAYGSMHCGVIEYMNSTDCSVVCTNKGELLDKINLLINDVSLQEKLYAQSLRMSIKHHNKKRNLNLSEKLFNDLIEQGGE